MGDLSEERVVLVGFLMCPQIYFTKPKIRKRWETAKDNYINIKQPFVTSFLLFIQLQKAIQADLSMYLNFQIQYVCNYYYY